MCSFVISACAHASIGAPGGKAVLGVVGERALHTHVRGLVSEAAGLQIVTRRRAAVIGEIVCASRSHGMVSAAGTPGAGSTSTSMSRGHLEFAMGMLEFHARHGIAEGVDLVAAP